MYPPIRLQPDNPHYFLFRGKPTILLTAGEHYSIMINKSFDHIRYLDTLQSLGFNHTRVYTGVKRERPGEHNIDGNTLAVDEKDFIGPWLRTDVPGALDGGNKYDLDKFNEEYFDRFRAILTEAGKRGIEMEIVVFAPLHLGGDGVGPWGICPLNIANNVNGVGDVKFWECNSMKDPKVVEYQDRYVRRLVTELNEFDNLHYEICNEPYLQPNEHVTSAFVHTDETMRLAWQQHVADVIWETESNLPNRHLISCNYLSGLCRILKPLRHVDLYCFHDTVPEITLRNYDLNCAIGMNETGIMEPPDYPKQAWMTVLGGMALYNFLDYSFIPGHEDGSYQPLPSNPGYTGMNGEDLRAELKALNDFINRFDFVKMRPANDLLLVNSGCNVEYQVLAEENEQYAIYQADTQHSGYGHAISMILKAEDGEYLAEFYDARTGELEGSYAVHAEDGLLKIAHGNPKTYPVNHPCRNAVRITRVHKE